MINKIALGILGLFIIGSVAIVATNGSKNSDNTKTDQDNVAVSGEKQTSSSLRDSEVEDDDADSDDGDDRVSTPVVNTAKPTQTTTTSTAKTYTMTDVASHKTESSCWTAINGNVYDLTAFITKHPGGDRNILKLCGLDGSRAFNGQHGGQSGPENVLAGFEVGTLVK